MKDMNAVIGYLLVTCSLAADWINGNVYACTPTMSVSVCVSEIMSSLLGEAR